MNVVGLMFCGGGVARNSTRMILIAIFRFPNT